MPNHIIFNHSFFFGMNHGRPGVRAIFHFLKQKLKIIGHLLRIQVETCFEAKSQK